MKRNADCLLTPMTSFAAVVKVDRRHNKCILDLLIDSTAGLLRPILPHDKLDFFIEGNDRCLRQMAI
jgi:hypothetical protein